MQADANSIFVSKAYNCLPFFPADFGMRLNDRQLVAQRTGTGYTSAGHQRSCTSSESTDNS